MYSLFYYLVFVISIYKSIVMNKIQLFLLNILLVVLVGCSKGGEDVPTPTPTPPSPPQKEDDFITLVTKEFAMGADGGTVTVPFTTNVSWSVSVNKDWCVVTPASGEAGTVELKATASANETSDNREAVITILAGTASVTAKVTQEVKAYITTESDTCQVAFIGGTIEVKISSNVSYQVSVDSDWIDKGSSTSSGAHKVWEFEVATTADKNSREGKITFSNADKNLETIVVVMQKGVPEDDSVKPSGSIGNMTWG